METPRLFSKLCVIQTKQKTAWLTQLHIDTSLGEQVLRQARPPRRRTHGPTCIRRHPITLALDPNQTEIPACCTPRHITLIQ
ncbi:hypothetical protein D3C85_1617200 [compost metagenome]